MAKPELLTVGNGEYKCNSMEKIKRKCYSTGRKCG